MSSRALSGVLIAVVAGSLLVACHPPEPASVSAAESLRTHAMQAGSTCVSVTRDGGPLVSDGSVDAEPVRAFSITKSVTALLVGIAQDEGYLDISDAAAKFVPQWQGTPSAAVTINDLLSHTSGREWDAHTDYREMALRAEDKTQFAIDLSKQNAPGEEWVYSNSAIQVLEAVLESATGVPADEYAMAQLFEPLGMTNTWIERDQAGNPNLFAGLWTTCDDLTRLGTLLLDGGTAPDGTQLISPEFLDVAVGQPSTDLNAAHGLLWWINHSGPTVTPEVATSGRGVEMSGSLVPEAPVDTLWALGLNDQILMVIPSEGVVAVRLGARPKHSSEFNLRSFSVHVLRVLTE